MPTFMALQKCPHLIIVPVHFEKYRHESARIRAIMREYTDLVEPLSLDEAYLDITESGRNGAEVAREIRRRIYQTTGLHASAGIAPNKLLAKIASDWKKPNGQFEVTTADVAAFMRDLPVRKIWGIGPKTAEKLAHAGITTCGQLQELSTLRMNELFGSFGSELQQLCRGEDDRPVEPHRVRKSLSTERTFERNLSTLEECRHRLDPIHAELIEDLRQHTESRAVTGVFVKLKFADFSQTTVSRAGAKPEPRIFDELLCEGFGRSGESVRLLGIGVRFSEGSAEEETQLELPLD
jgi:DNA polymerase-4